MTSDASASTVHTPPSRPTTPMQPHNRLFEPHRSSQLPHLVNVAALVTPPPPPRMTSTQIHTDEAAIPPPAKRRVACEDTIRTANSERARRCTTCSPSLAKAEDGYTSSTTTAGEDRSTDLQSYGRSSYFLDSVEENWILYPLVFPHGVVDGICAPFKRLDPGSGIQDIATMRRKLDGDDDWIVVVAAASHGGDVCADRSTSSRDRHPTCKKLASRRTGAINETLVCPDDTVDNIRALLQVNIRPTNEKWMELRRTDWLYCV
ncbi:hypothetical protein GALMADRAFT_149023 [Galerina marginata CBS 339.88]|uniref:Uncharacterized protein n=1 Tax=Galerina marginata (strain CBS 339.88) TaxID=685588 RepID=A0A067S2R2_GALM3|nr:hypothetical protein GALMADRAFT_149023 [Galerina marginata CBS 339.88]